MEKERVPKESETIAAKRLFRFSEKLRRTKGGLSISVPWWSNSVFEVFGLLTVVALNLFLLYPYLSLPPHETSFSGPLIPLLAKTLGVFGFSFAYSTSLIEAIFFLLLPLTFYLFIKRVVGRKLMGFLAIALISLPFYPFALSRINSIFFLGDGPFISSLTITPLAIYFLLIFEREGKLRNLIFASTAATLVALTSPFGLFTLIGLAFLTTFSEMLLGKGRVKAFRFVMVLIVTAGLSSFWYHPAFAWALFWSPKMTELRQSLGRLLPISLFLVPILATFGYLLFDRKPELQPLFLASFYTIAFGLVIWVGEGLLPSTPPRYLPVFGLSLSFLLSVVTVGVADWLRFKDGVRVFGLKGGVLANLLIVISLVCLISAIFLGRVSEVNKDTSVLGAWTDVNKGDIWVSRETFAGPSPILGYLLSGATLLSISYLGVLPYIKRRTFEKQ